MVEFTSNKSLRSRGKSYVRLRKIGKSKKKKDRRVKYNPLLMDTLPINRFTQNRSCGLTHVFEMTTISIC
jgi:hypothetical protein